MVIYGGAGPWMCTWKVALRILLETNSWHLRQGTRGTTRPAAVSVGPFQVSFLLFTDENTKANNTKLVMKHVAPIQDPTSVSRIWKPVIQHREPLRKSHSKRRKNVRSKTTISKPMHFTQKGILWDSHSGPCYFYFMHNANRIGNATF